jgi:tetratricopeptide (TPR) repeat protein
MPFKRKRSPSIQPLRPPTARHEESIPALFKKEKPKSDLPSKRNLSGSRWEWLTFLALCILLYHVLGLWYRWLRPDPEFLRFTTEVSKLLALGSFLGLQTQGGHRFILQLDSLLPRIPFFKTARRVCLTTWLIAVFAAFLLYLGSPLATEIYNRHGVTALEHGQYGIAIRDFRQAISLSPDDAHAHYNLASTYEALHKDKEAIDEYQQALELNEDFWPVYNNLGRLYLQSQHDPNAALTVLLAGQGRVTDPLGSAVIRKNIAWAYQENELPNMALSILGNAIGDLQALQIKGGNLGIFLADAYRIQALANETLGDVSAARRAWQDSLGYALSVVESEGCVKGNPYPPPDCLDAMKLTSEAREHAPQ